MLPIYLLLIGMGMSWLLSRRPNRVWFKPVVLLIVVGYAGVNARDLYEPRAKARYEILAAEYEFPSADGRPLREWVESHVPRTETIVSTDGQATGYLLQRPTLSMVSSLYSPVRWECAEVKKQMERFHANYLFLYKPASGVGADGLLGESRFVAASVLDRPACGFVIAAENADIRIVTQDRSK